MLLGLDIGSSSVKAALVDDQTGKCVAQATYPDAEMPIQALQKGWAEQSPEMWWENTVNALRILKGNHPQGFASIKSIGIGYQMHGLVTIDKNGNTVRPSIIWCDSRAVAIGEKAFKDLGQDWCLKNLLNSPGNFTASKLRWVRENEPELFGKINKFMLPGDYIAYRLTGEISTTETGMSEGIFWDFEAGTISEKLLDHYQIDKSLLPALGDSFSIQGQVVNHAADATGLKVGIPVSYRAGDQPNNAFSLNVLHPGETAATAGTSGVIYAVSENNRFDPQSRVNTFLHVNHTANLQRNGILLCINGTGILNSWLRKNFDPDGKLGYDDMNQIAAQAPVGALGLSFYPFGNGAERVLGNKNPGAMLRGLDLNRHDRSHLFRAAQEGIVFAMAYGFEVLKSMGVNTQVVRAGRANMFLSPLFRQSFVNTLQVPLELYDTNGAVGAAIGSGVGAGIYESFPEAFRGLNLLQTEEPSPKHIPEFREAFSRWQAGMIF
ncbi:MAG: carbohydrate kinase [Bacteroidetes bacterium]|nr:carbohydrate kinase [Bacteroidota bacterium]